MPRDKEQQASPTNTTQSFQESQQSNKGKKVKELEDQLDTTEEQQASPTNTTQSFQESLQLSTSNQNAFVDWRYKVKSKEKKSNEKKTFR